MDPCSSWYLGWANSSYKMDFVNANNKFVSYFLYSFGMDLTHYAFIYVSQGIMECFTSFGGVILKE